MIQIELSQDEKNLIQGYKKLYKNNMCYNKRDNCLKLLFKKTIFKIERIFALKRQFEVCKYRKSFRNESKYNFICNFFKIVKTYFETFF